MAALKEPSPQIWERVNREYVAFYQRILEEGQHQPSRYGDSVEALNQQFAFRAGAVLARRGQNLKIGWVELIQLIGGMYDPEAYGRYAPKSGLSLFTREMAYGPRTIGEIPGIIDTLRRDPDNRQCVLFIGRQGQEGTPSLPCTVCLQFLLRRPATAGHDRENGPAQSTDAAAHEPLLLHCNVFMRSLDVVLGLPVDVIMFGGLTRAMASCLGAVPGKVTITAGSAHIYRATMVWGKVPLHPGPIRSFSLTDEQHAPTNWRAWIKRAIDDADWSWSDCPPLVQLRQHGRSELTKPRLAGSPDAH